MSHEEDIFIPRVVGGLLYFDPDEFKCNCGCKQNKMDSRFCGRLDFARSQAGVPFIINSAYRCPTYNKTVGGKPNSAHTLGCAVDIAVANSHQRFKILESLIRGNFNRIGIANSFIHVDDDRTKPKEVCWLY